MKFLALPLLLLAPLPCSAEELEVGAAAVPITPAVGTPMAGYYSLRRAEGTHDELFAKVIVLKRGDARAAMVSLDLLDTPRSLAEDARREVEKVAKVRGDDVMISATHAHTGPVLAGGSPRWAVIGTQDDLAVAYRAELPGKIAEAVRLAESRLAPATLSATHGHETKLGYNRRFHMKDGTVGWNPGVLNPKILKPAGPIDPDVAVLLFEGLGKDKTPVASYVNYAVHLDTVGGAKFSADMPHTLAKLLADGKGADFVSFYTSGCCGDINHINVNWGKPQGGHAFSSRMGVILAGEVLRVWPELKPVEGGTLRSRSVMVGLPLPPLAEGAVEKAEETLKRFAGPVANRPTFLETVDAFKVLDVADREGRPIEVEVQVIALGRDVAWVSLPGEIFVELGLTIKHDSPFAHTVIAELANGAIGYIPSRRAYPQGNYEVVSARCAEGSGERLVDAALKLLRELYAEAAADPQETAARP